MQATMSFHRKPTASAVSTKRTPHTQRTSAATRRVEPKKDTSSLYLDIMMFPA